jgi:hypothetical protein
MNLVREEGRIPDIRSNSLPPILPSSSGKTVKGRFFLIGIPVPINSGKAPGKLIENWFQGG